MSEPSGVQEFRLLSEIIGDVKVMLKKFTEEELKGQYNFWVNTEKILLKLGWYNKLLSPKQKSRIITVIKSHFHTYCYWCEDKKTIRIDIHPRHRTYCENYTPPRVESVEVY